MTPTESPSRVVLYARVSTVEQAREGLSLQLQESRMRSYAQAQDYTVIGCIQDDGYSGKSLDRPGMQTVRRLASDGAVDGVVIFKLDRLTRSVVDFGTLLGELESAGVALVSVRDHLDTRSAGGRLVTNIMLSVSQWEREVIAERTSEALAEARRRGTYLGKPPVGYRVENGALVATEQHAVVQEAHRLREQGMTMREIAAAISRCPDLCRVAGRTRWHATTVARLLRSPLLPVD